MKKISAIILTKNEEEYLPNCLKSLKWADEILVVDSGSKDKTLEIAEKFGAKIITNEWKGFPEQRNIGAKHASGDWLLYVDADERVSKKLAKEIQELLTAGNQRFTSYKIPHKNIILEKWLKFGGWYPEYQHRLINKSAFKKWTGELHEHPIVEGAVGELKSDLIHLTHRGVEWMLKKTIRYTKIEAQLRLQANHPKVKTVHLFTASFREFWYRAVIKSGWRDGIEGFIEIIYQSFNHFLIMFWLWELQKPKNMKDKYQKLDQEIASEL